MARMALINGDIIAGCAQSVAAGQFLSAHKVDFEAIQNCKCLSNCWKLYKTLQTCASKNPLA